MPSPAPESPPRRREAKHLSHSSRETLERCAKSWFLKYMTPAPKRPALWSVGGSAVHEATEVYDLLVMSGQNASEMNVKGVWDAFFGEQLAKARAKEPNESKWGSSSAEPIEVWNKLGPQFIQSYIDWRERSPWEIWTTPHGEPAIELDVTGYLPGCPVEIKAYLDRVFVDKLFNKLVVFDLKSGKRAPTKPDQFGTYAALIKVKYGVSADMGVAFMNRKGTVGRPFDLTEHTPEFVGEIFGTAWEQIQTGEFPASGFPGGCFICDVKSSCAAQNGPLAHLYDPAHPGYPQAA